MGGRSFPVGGSCFQFRVEHRRSQTGYVVEFRGSPGTSGPRLTQPEQLHFISWASAEKEEKPLGAWCTATLAESKHVSQNLALQPFLTWFAPCDVTGTFQAGDGHSLSLSNVRVLN